MAKLGEVVCPYCTAEYKPDKIGFWSKTTPNEISDLIRAYVVFFCPQCYKILGVTSN